MEDYMTVGDVQSLFRCSRYTVYSWIDRGIFPGAIRPGGGAWRIPRSDVEAVEKGESCNKQEPKS